MRVSEQSGLEAQLNAQQRIDQQKTSNGFSRVMSQNKHREDAEDGRSKRSNRHGTASSNIANDQQISRPGVIGQQALIPQVDGPADLHAGRTPAPGVATKSPGMIAEGTIHIQALAAEVGAHIDLVKQGKTSQTIHMSFDSKTLQGLQVQIRSQNGEVAIHFMAQSDGMSNMLKSHSTELRDALTSKGVKVSNIAVANVGARAVERRDRNV